MNKTQILKIFKNSRNIKQTRFNYKSNAEIKKEFIANIKANITMQDGSKIPQHIFDSTFKQKKDSFEFGQHFVLKNKLKRVNFINKLTWDIKTTSIKDYDKVNGRWFKTSMALYEI